MAKLTIKTQADADKVKEGDEYTFEYSAYDPETVMKEYPEFEKLHKSIEERIAKDRENKGNNGNNGNNGNKVVTENDVYAALRGLTAEQMAKKFKKAELQAYAEKLGVAKSGTELQISKRIIEALTKNK